MTPLVSVLIPALNEAAGISATLAAARAALGDQAEYIVADGQSSDGTAELARAAGARVIESARGRGRQLDAALRAAQGEICIMLHADTLLPTDALTHIVRALRSAIGGAFLLRFDDARLQWLARVINLRSRVLRSATGDQAIFARRDVLLAVGGVPQLELFEDVRLWQKLKRAGRTQILASEVTTSARLWRSAGTSRVILLHWRLRLLHALGVSPERLARLYPTSGS
jgi:rSAM/selenodomain-associated transferase 2